MIMIQATIIDTVWSSDCILSTSLHVVNRVAGDLFGGHRS